MKEVINTNVGNFLKHNLKSLLVAIISLSFVSITLIVSDYLFVKKDTQSYELENQNHLESSFYEINPYLNFYLIDIK